MKVEIYIKNPDLLYMIANAMKLEGDERAAWYDTYTEYGDYFTVELDLDTSTFEFMCVK